VKELDQLAKSTLTFKVSPKEGIMEFRLPPDLASALSRKPAAYVELGSLLSEQGLEQFLKEVFVTLPNARIKKGHHWQQKGTLGPGVKYEDDLTYRGPKPKEPSSEMIEMKRKAVSEGGAEGAVEEQESKGELILESGTGRLKQMELQHRLRISQSTTLPNKQVLKHSLAFECVDKATTSK
jgi:hypothetical protein